MRRAKVAPEKGQEEAVLAQAEGWPGPDRSLFLGLHALIRAEAPGLTPRLWYGMPAYAHQGKVLCFFQPAHKFKTRYATLGFSDQARLDQGNLWPVAFALAQLTPAEESWTRELPHTALGR